MANSTGRPINLPGTRVANIGVTDVPTIRVAQTDGGAGAMFTVANVLQDVSSRIEKRLDVQAQVEGRKAGQLAGMSGELPQLMDDTTIRGNAFNESAKDAALTELSLESSSELRGLEEKYSADPVKYKQGVDSYLNGKIPSLTNFDPEVAQKYKANFLLRAETGLERVKEKQRSIIRDQMTERALRLQMAASDEMAAQAQAVFAGRPEDVQKNLALLFGNAGRIADAANQIGPDGRPLFSAHQRVAFEEEAQKTLASQVAKAWMGTQTDLLGAWQTWQKGEASITVADAKSQQSVKMNLREVLVERFYSKAQSAFMDELKGQLALESQLSAVAERNFKRQSDALFSELSIRAQDGALALPEVESLRGSLEPEKFIALRTLAKTGGASVSDGATLTRLTVADVDGQNVTTELNTAYEQGKLSRQDFIQLYERNSKRLTEGQKDPISQGRDLVSGSLGKLSTELGIAQSSLIAEAEADYALRVDDLIRSKRAKQKPDEPAVTQRDLSLRETLDIAKQVRDRYSLMAGEKSIETLPLPDFISASQRANRTFSTKDVEGAVQKTKDFYLKKNGGNADLLRDDKAFQEQMLLLKKHHDALMLRKGADNGGQPAQ